MKEMGIRAQWVKPWTITTIDSDFSNELQNILNEQFTPDRPNAVWCSDITYIWTTDNFHMEYIHIGFATVIVWIAYKCIDFIFFLSIVHIRTGAERFCLGDFGKASVFIVSGRGHHRHRHGNSEVLQSTIIWCCQLDCHSIFVHNIHFIQQGAG